MRVLFNDGWEFGKTEADESAKPVKYKPVDIPHDWLIYQTNDLYETGFGHYRKEYDFGDVSGRSVRLYFEGVYMDCTVYINGEAVCDNKYGYSSFEADLTGRVHDGVNTVEVKVRHRSPNSRWYSGAGIFRDVWLINTPKAYILTNGVYFHTEPAGGGFKCHVSADMVCEKGMSVRFMLRSGRRFLYLKDMRAAEHVAEEFVLTDVKQEDIWDIDSPNLLELEVALFNGVEEIDVQRMKVGLRAAEFTPDGGFFLNGRHVKLHGVCLHHDQGCLGAAFNKSAERRRLLLMKEMGVNAVRTSHNMPAAAFMELCDELGILVDSEAFDMWERPKTEYDYARFFDDWYERDVRSWVERDRNHPSLIMWSVGNEIYDTHASPRGAEVAGLLHAAVRRYDPLGNAPTTIGSNYMPWEGAQTSAKHVDLAGYNYGENLYAKHHEQHPEWRIYGSETTSGVKSRGVYHFPRSAAFLTHEDLQCSSLGNCRAGISAETAQKVIAADRDTPYCAGMFIWTGGDYIGEPSPYSTKNAYYGNIDTAGLKKDSFYLYKAAWTDEPVLHLFPYWDHNEGQLTDVVAYTNLAEAELFVNGISAGRQRPVEYTAAWQVPYSAGEIRIVGRDASGNVYEDVRHSFGDTSSLKLTCDREFIYGDGEDIAAVEVSAVDENGYPVDNARDRVRISVEGGRLLGFDNGDSTDYDPYKCGCRKLFSGKAVAYVASDGEGELRVSAVSCGCRAAELVIPVKKASPRHGAAYSEDVQAAGGGLCEEQAEIPVRKIELRRNTGSLLTPDQTVSEVEYSLRPADASHRNVKCSIVTESGIATNIAVVEETAPGRLTVRAIGDGSFRLRVTADNGKPQAEVISEYEYSAQGFGRLSTDPYEFVYGSLYSDSLKQMDEVRGGGVSITADNNIVGFLKTDFGRYGSDAFTVRIINWFKNDPFGFRLYTGKPGSEGAVCLGSFTYQADFEWQTYKDNSYTLAKTLKGVQDIYFEFDRTDLRIDFGGFVFTPRLKAYETLAAADCDLIHGDSFRIDGGRVLGIGNNVFMDFTGIDLVHGAAAIELTGRTRHDLDSVHVAFASDEGTVYGTVMEFERSDDFITLRQELPELTGSLTLKIFFLPGCDFDLESVRIIPGKGKGIK